MCTSFSYNHPEQLYFLIFLHVGSVFSLNSSVNVKHIAVKGTGSFPGFVVEVRQALDVVCVGHWAV